jgi:DNA-binding MltR family transcriptional regulator
MASRNRGKKKLSLRRLSTERPTTEEAQALLASLAECLEPTAVAVMASALVEHELDLMIQHRLPRSDDDTWESLTSDTGPLNSFHTKIQIGYALRIYDKELLTNLNIIRTIRNTLAHARRRLSFEHSLIAAEFEKFCSPKRTKALHKLSMKAISASYWPPNSPTNKRFILLCSCVILSLKNAHVLTLNRRVNPPYSPAHA